MEEASAPVKKSLLSTTSIRLIIAIGVIIFLIAYQLMSEQIPIQAIIKNREAYRDYQLTLSEIMERIYNMKDYLITMIILYIIYYYLAVSNRKWEEENLLKEKVEKGKLNTIKEEEENDSLSNN